MGPVHRLLSACPGPADQEVPGRRAGRFDVAGRPAPSGQRQIELVFHIAGERTSVVATEDIKPDRAHLPAMRCGGDLVVTQIGGRCADYGPLNTLMLGFFPVPDREA